MLGRKLRLALEALKELEMVEQLHFLVRTDSQRQRHEGLGQIF